MSRHKRFISSIDLFIICCIFYLVYLLQTKFTYHKQIIYRQLSLNKIHHSKPKGGITIVINTNTKNIDTRVKWHLNHFQESGISKYPQIHPVFTSNDIFNSTFPVVVVPPEEYDKTRQFYRKKKHIYRKRTQIYAATSYKHSMLYFLEETEDDWVVRIDDDAGVYLPNVQKALSRLEKYYDPKKLLLFGGFAISKKSRKNIGGNDGFLHGGSGFLFSRAGAEFFIKHFDEWASTMRLPNDVHIQQIMELFNMTFADSFFPGMTSSFIKKFYKNVAKSQHDSNPEKYFSKDTCISGDKLYKFKNESYTLDSHTDPTQIGYPLNDVFIYHKFWEFDKYETTWDKVLEHGLPKDAYYYNCNFTCNTCRPQTPNTNN